MSHVSRYLDPTLVEHLNQLQLSARSVVEGTTSGQHRSPVKGASIEFRQHRFYVPGDEPKRLDWRVLGRTDRPYVKEYDEETNLRCVLLLDQSGSMGYRGSGEQSKFEFAAGLGAALGYLMLAQTESVGIAVTGVSGGRKSAALEHYVAPHAGHLQLARVLEVIDRSVPRGASGIAPAMHALSERLERRALVIVLSDFFAPSDEIRSGLAHLRHGRHEVIAVQMVDRDEEEFTFRGWTRFAGLEGEGAQTCDPALAARRYHENFARHRTALKQVCQALRCEFQAFTTDRTTLEAVRLFLVRRESGRP